MQKKSLQVPSHANLFSLRVESQINHLIFMQTVLGLHVEAQLKRLIFDAKFSALRIVSYVERLILTRTFWSYVSHLTQMPRHFDA